MILGKQAWRLFENLTSLYARVMKGRCFINSHLMKATSPRSSSRVWKAIFCGRKVLEWSSSIVMARPRNDGLLPCNLASKLPVNCGYADWACLRDDWRRIQRVYETEIWQVFFPLMQKQFFAYQRNVPSLMIWFLGQGKTVINSVESSQGLILMKLVAQTTSAA